MMETTSYYHDAAIRHGFRWRFRSAAQILACTKSCGGSTSGINQQPLLLPALAHEKEEDDERRFIKIAERETASQLCTVEASREVEGLDAK